MKFLILLSMLYFPTANADPGLDKLKQSFSGLIQSSIKQFDKAATMKPVVLKKGAEISKTDCDAIAAKIKTNYKIDPFNFVFEGGSTTDAMCGGRWGYDKNFTQKISGATNMGQAYSLIIQLEEQNVWGSQNYITTYFIDSAYHIVEKQTLMTLVTTSELSGYLITSVDAGGDVYSSQYDKNYGISGGIAQDVSGTHTIEKYVPADGSAPFPLIRNTVKNKSDPSKDYQILLLERADQKDWQDFQLPITFAWDGGFYNYGGKYYANYNKPTFKSEITIKFRGGKEYCAEGDIKEDQKWTSFPADSSSYYNCVNY